MPGDGAARTYANLLGRNDTQTDRIAERSGRGAKAA